MGDSADKEGSDPDDDRPTIAVEELVEPADSVRDSAPASLIGRVFSDRYRIDAQVAKGSMGAVYRGFHLKMRKEVAIKVLHTETENFPDLVERFEREAIVGAHIRHPNIAYASDMGMFGKSCFLVMEFVRGPTLRELIDSDAPLRVERAVKLMRQLASALQAAHEQGVIHRDLKPPNIMVTSGKDEQAKLLDFGLAKVPLDRMAPSNDDKDRERLSQPDVVFGSVAYMAPEISSGMDAIDARSDLYSLGLIFYEMLSGKHPFDPGTPVEVLLHHKTTMPPPIGKRNPTVAVPRALEAVVMKLLEKEPDNRYQDAASVVKALEGRDKQDESSIPRAFITIAQGPSRKSAATMVVLFALGGALLILVYAIATRGKKESADAAATPSATAAASGALAGGADSAAAAASAAASDPELASTLSKDLVAAAKAQDWAEGAAVLVALADADKTALKGADAQAAAAKIANGIVADGGSQIDEVFYALSRRYGTDGLDVLYDVGMKSENAKASNRANAILEASTARMTPALRIAIEVKKATCREKPLLFGRAGKDGDDRVLALLEKLKPPACEPDAKTCCFRRHVGLEKTIAKLKGKPSED